MSVLSLFVFSRSHATVAKRKGRGINDKTLSRNQSQASVADGPEDVVFDAEISPALPRDWGVSLSDRKRKRDWTGSWAAVINGFGEADCGLSGCLSVGLTRPESAARSHLWCHFLDRQSL